MGKSRARFQQMVEPSADSTSSTVTSGGISRTNCVVAQRPGRHANGVLLFSARPRFTRLDADMCHRERWQGEHERGEEHCPLHRTPLVMSAIVSDGRGSCCGTGLPPTALVNAGEEMDLHRLFAGL